MIIASLLFMSLCFQFLLVHDNQYVDNGTLRISSITLPLEDIYNRSHTNF